MADNSRKATILESLNLRDPEKRYGDKLKYIMINETCDTSDIIQGQGNTDDLFAFIIYTGHYTYFRYQEDDKIHFVPRLSEQ